MVGILIYFLAKVLSENLINLKKTLKLISCEFKAIKRIIPKYIESVKYLMYYFTKHNTEKENYIKMNGDIVE